jgi:hypothetical protein
MRTKYIVGELTVPAGSVLGAVAFPEYVEHAHMAKAFEPGEDNLISAGFFQVIDGEVHPYGESVGLGLASRPEDAQIIAKAIGLHPRSR